MALQFGTRLGPYEVTAQIGVGGMGEVYRATDTKPKRDVAVKVLPSALAADPELTCPASFSAATGQHGKRDDLSRETPEQLLKSIVDGINAGNLDALMTLYEPEAAFATQPGSLAHGLPGVRESLAGFIAMKGTLDLKVTRVLEASDLALVIGVWSFTGTGPDGEPVKLTGHSADVLRRHADGSWRFVIDNPWGTD